MKLAVEIPYKNPVGPKRRHSFNIFLKEKYIEERCLNFFRGSSNLTRFVNVNDIGKAVIKLKC